MKWWWSDSSPPPAPVHGTSASDVAIPTPPGASELSQRQSQTAEEELSQFIPGLAKSDVAESISKSQQRDAPQSAFASTVYPTTMSCREAFDSAMHCRGPGGQFLNLYRYGEFRQCSEQWSQFWFCMRVRTKPKAVKEEMIREFYREKEEKRYEGMPNSEDVWEERTERLTRAFDDDLRKITSMPLEDTRQWRRSLKKDDDGNS